MIKSMTGFSSASVDHEVGTAGATIRTVNHRFLDLQLRVPQAMAAEESKLRSLVQARLARGRVELSVTVERRRPAQLEVNVNEALIDTLAQALEGARRRGLIDGPISPGDMLRFPQVVSLAEAERDPDEEASVVAAVAAAVGEAVAAVDAMRATEGEHLRIELNTRVGELARLVDGAEEVAREGAALLRQRLADRIEELVGDGQAEAALVAQEIVKFVARSDITEELVRLRGHLEHWRALSDGPEPCGRKLEFLLQEMNREVNTLGAKAEGVGVSEIIVAAKAELEKLREQVQNVE